eukprot:6376943-Prorocentrum_lima.AAC.1
MSTLIVLFHLCTNAVTVCPGKGDVRSLNILKRWSSSCKSMRPGGPSSISPVIILASTSTCVACFRFQVLPILQ